MEEQSVPPKPKMNPMLLIGVALVLFAIVAGGWMLLSNNSSSSQSSKIPQAEPQVPTQAQEISSVSPTPEDQEAMMEKGVVKEFVVEGSSFKFVPNEIRVKKGDTVKVTFKNTGGFHNFVIDELNVGIKQIQGPAQESVEFTVAKAGQFEYYCSVGNHRQLGMKGTLIVQ